MKCKRILEKIKYPVTDIRLLLIIDNLKAN